MLVIPTSQVYGENLNLKLLSTVSLVCVIFKFLSLLPLNLEGKVITSEIFCLSACVTLIMNDII